MRERLSQSVMRMLRDIDSDIADVDVVDIDMETLDPLRRAIAPVWAPESVDTWSFESAVYYGTAGRVASSASAYVVDDDAVLS